MYPSRWHSQWRDRLALLNSDLHIQHVCGLVKQQQVRFGEERSRQGDTHPPTSAEGLRGRCLRSNNTHDVKNQSNYYWFY